MKSSALATAAFLAAGTAAAEPPSLVARVAVQLPSSAPRLGDQISQGCYSSPGNLVFDSMPRYNTRASCGKDICLTKLQKSVAATSAGNQCFCGDNYPPNSTRVDDSNCNMDCAGYGSLEACGAVDFFSVYNTGLNLSVHNLEDVAKPSTSSTPSVVTTTGSGGVVTVTNNVSTTPPPSSGGSGPNTAGIAAGVVVGIIAIAAIAGGIFFYMRRRRNRELEDEHRRNAAVNSFVNGSKPPGSSGGFSIPDERLDPAVMAQRRYSNGSIADNQDYSRKILRVTNA